MIFASLACKVQESRHKNQESRIKTMKQQDTYTKVILTVIAGCLVVLTLNNVNLLPAAYANDEPTINDLFMNESVDVYIKDFPYETLSVEIKNNEVEITDFPYEELNINIAEIGGTSTSSGYLTVQER